MTTAEARSFVRPQFVKWSALAFAMLLPILTYTLWDYIEMRRFRSRLDAIAARGEPISIQGPLKLSDDAADADRLYRAAGALAMSFSAGQPSSVQIALHSNGDLPEEAVGAARTVVSKYGEALALADRAAELPFEGFRPGTTFNYLVSSILDVSRLCDLRAKLAIIDGRADAAVDSLYTQARLKRIAATFVLLNQMTLSMVVERTHPSPSALRKLAGAFGDLDRDDYLKHDFIRLRAQAVDSSQMPLSSGLFAIRQEANPQPWEVHRYTRALDTFAQIIAMTEQPDPARIPAVLAVGRFPDVLPQSTVRSRENLEGFVHARVRSAAIVRASRTLVAVERFRRDHDERMPADLQELVPTYLERLPIDPYTGQAMRYRALERGYTVYSVGPNGRDDGGEMTLAERRELSLRDRDHWRNRDDAGIRVQ